MFILFFKDVSINSRMIVLYALKKQNIDICVKRDVGFHVVNYALKKFKNKVKDANILLELRERQHYKKKSDKKREKKNLAKIRHKYRQEKEKSL